MLEIRALAEDWQDTGTTRLLMDADHVARDPRLVLVGSGTSTRGGRRIFGRGGSGASTPAQRYAEAYQKVHGSVEVSRSTLEEAAFARVHLADLLTAGRALEHGHGRLGRLGSLAPSTRADLLVEVMAGLEKGWDELVRTGNREGRTHAGMAWELERVRAYLSPAALHSMAHRLEGRTMADGARMTVAGLGVVSAMVPPEGACSRTALLLASSFMTGNFSFLAMPQEAPATAMLVVQMADGLLRDRDVGGLAAMVPDGVPELLDILSDSPRVNGLVVFSRSEVHLRGLHRAAVTGKATVGAWATSDVALVWDSAHVDEAAREIARARFTDAGRLPGSLTRVIAHREAVDDLVQALEGEINSLRLGLPSEPDVDVGPVPSLEAMEHLEDVVSEAKELGARVVRGGERVNWRAEADPLGMFLQPTLLDECDAGMRCVNEALVGPVLPVCSVEDDSEAAALADRPHRPGRVWLWATSRADRERLADRLRAPVILFSGRVPEGLGGELDLVDAWGSLELSERLRYRSWLGPAGQ